MAIKFRDRIKLVVFDFDGTATDAEAEGVPYTTGFLADLVTLTGLSAERVAELHKEYVAKVAAEPNRYGWEYGGMLVAPAMVDPYLRMAPVARMIFEASGLNLPSEFVNRLLTGLLYKYNYAKTTTAFRPGAFRTFERAAHICNAIYVVTNSDPGVVTNKIRQLIRQERPEMPHRWLTDSVRGNAKKYVVTPESVPGIQRELRIDGLDRPVYLERPHYHKVLDDIRLAHGIEWGEMAVVGDIFELDLALPLALGANILHLVNEFTSQYERDYVGGLPNGRVITQFTEVLDYLG